MTELPQQGVVVDFDDHVGLGHVLANGKTYLFHCTQIAGGSRTIDPGVAVAFRLVERHKGPEAYEVTPAS